MAQPTNWVAEAITNTAVWGGEIYQTGALELESGYYLLLENGDKLLLG